MTRSAKPSQFEVYKAADGSFRWRLIGTDGKIVRIDAGTAPGLRRKRGYAAVKRAVQAALAQAYERQQHTA